MRNAFVKLLIKWAQHDENVYLLTGDLGFSVLEPFKEKFPERFVNVGISEQNMIGVAAGLAKQGKTVFVYSIVNFATLRCLEQIRNDVCYHNANVIVTIVGGGFAYGTHGYTHLGLEDIAALLPLPNMKIFSPADPEQLEYCMNIIKNHRGPCYLRMARGGEPSIIEDYNNLSIFEDYDINTEINLLSHGTILSEVLKARNLLKSEHGIEVGVQSLPFLNGFDENRITTFLLKSKLVFIVEEHMKKGGLAGIISGIGAKLGPKCPYIFPLGADDTIMHTIGKQDYLRMRMSIDYKSIIRHVLFQVHKLQLSQKSFYEQV